MKRIIIIIVSAICGTALLYGIFIFVVGPLLIGGFFNPPISKEKMTDIFNKDQTLLLDVAQYLANSDYEDVYIHDIIKNNKISITGGYIEIKDENVIKTINTLIKNGYSAIEKTGNTISYQRWSNLDNGRGIACSIDDSEPEMQFLTKIEPLSEPNWYYYEEDFNEWKRRDKLK